MAAREGLKAIMEEPANKSVIRSFIAFTVAMIAVPIVVFFGVRSLAASYFALPSSGANLWAGILSAVSVNVIMVFYVILAWNEQIQEGSGKAGTIKALEGRKDK